MTRVFISYHRADSAMAAGRIHDRLVQDLGPESVFKDVDDIPPGADFRVIVAREVARCDVMLVLIGPQWLHITDPATGARRLDNPADFVRIEVESGLTRPECQVVPVLLRNTPMPPVGDLPASMQELGYRNAVTIRDDPDFNRDIARLIDWLRDYTPAPPVIAPPRPQPPQVSPRDDRRPLALTQTFASAHGVTFKYPAGWVAGDDDEESALVANSQAVYNKANSDADIPVERGEVAIIFLGLNKIDPESDLPPPELSEIMEFFLEELTTEGMLALGRPQPVNAGPHHGLKVSVRDPAINGEGFLVAFEHNNTFVVGMLFTATGDTKNFEALGLDIIGSATYTAPAE